MSVDGKISGGKAIRGILSFDTTFDDRTNQRIVSMSGNLLPLMLGKEDLKALNLQKVSVYMQAKGAFIQLEGKQSFCLPTNVDSAEKMGSAGSLELTLPTGATGRVDGTLSLSQGNSRVFAADSGALRFGSGARFYMAAAETGSPFGSGLGASGLGSVSRYPYLFAELLKRGYSAAAIQVVELVPPARERLTEQFGVRCAAVADDAVLACDVLVLAVKPQQLRDALAPLAGRLSCQLVLSIAAGVRMVDIARWLGDYRCIVRAMPNTPLVIKRGITAFTGNKYCTGDDIQMAREIFENVGEAIYLEQEKLLHAVTGLSGSGPAYVYLFLQNLEDAGVLLGLTRADSRKLALQTVLGSAELARQSQVAPQELAHDVTSPGGTTAVALKSLHRHGFPNAVMEAVTAATRRSVELASEAHGGAQTND